MWFSALRRRIALLEKLSAQRPPLAAQEEGLTLTHGGVVHAEYKPDEANLIRLRLWTGTDSFGRPMPEYRPSTRKRKLRRKLPSKNIVLFETGALYRSIRIRRGEGEFIITAQRKNLRYILERFPAVQWLALGPFEKRRIGEAAKRLIIAALLGGCSMFKPAKRTQVVQRDSFLYVSHYDTVRDTIQLITRLRDTVRLPHFKMYVLNDTVHNVLRITQIRELPRRVDTVFVYKQETKLIPHQKEGRRGWGVWFTGIFAGLLFIFILWLIVRRFA